MTPVHVTSFEVQTCVFITNKSIIKKFLGSVIIYDGLVLGREATIWS